MSANASALSMNNPILVYSILWFYGVFTTVVLLYFYQQFTATKRLLMTLTEEWETVVQAVTMPEPIPVQAPAAVAAAKHGFRLLSFEKRQAINLADQPSPDRVERM